MFKDIMFHPNELALCGYSGSGKTTLIESLFKKLSPQYRIGYIKHDAHNFEMDKEGKDTWKALNSGAHEIFIHNDDQWARIGQGETNLFDIKSNILNLDFALVEGHKNTQIPKLIVLGNDKTEFAILEDYHNGKLKNVLGFIGSKRTCPIKTQLPYFYHNDISEISNFIIKYFDHKMQTIPLYGLVLSGGKSQRMGQDKTALNYHGMEQSQYMAKLLDQYCEKTFISCRNDQEFKEHLNTHEQIHDSFENIGPMGGILSAFQKHPNAAWLVMACDLPFVDESMLNELIEERNRYRAATCFLNPEKGWAEPLCTIYEPKSYARLLQFFAHGYKCPRKMLMNTVIQTITSKNARGLENANTPEDFSKFKEQLL